MHARRHTGDVKRLLFRLLRIKSQSRQTLAQMMTEMGWYEFHLEGVEYGPDRVVVRIRPPGTRQ